MSLALALNGARRVYILGRRAEALQKVAAQSPHNNIVPLVGDVTSKDSLAAAAARVRDEVGHADVVICNSGVGGPLPAPAAQPDKEQTLEDIQAYLWSVPWTDFSRTLDVNVTGVWYTAIAFLPLLIAANKLRPAPSTYPRPQIITTGSIGGFNRMPLAGYAYGASKAAVHHMTKSMATMWGKFDIRANAIAPGLYYSELAAPVFEKMGLVGGAEGESGKGTKEGSFPREAIPQTRAGGEEDMAGVVLWMCGRAGAYLSGNVVVTDGGRLGVHPATY